MGKRQREIKASEATNAEGEASTSSSLTVMSSAAPSAHAVGIASIALNPKEDRLVAAREDGSLALCKVLPFTGRVMAALVPLTRTGSFDGHSVVKVLYALEGSVIIAAYLSGQIVVYDEATLTILYVAERVGGAIWDMTSLRGDNSSEEIICACADGSWYHYQLIFNQDKFQLNLVQVLPKIVGAHRALAVAVCGKLIVGTDDCSNIVAWPVPEKGSRSGQHKWLTRLPKGAYAKTIAYDTETNFVVVGTSLGDVAFIRADKGDIVALFTNHQGPITSVISAGARTILATGWHESLRAYRFVEGKWIPSEVRRRTHYHEATQLLHLKKSNVVFGSSRDGTLLIASLADNFGSAPKYVQICPQRYCFAASASVVVTAIGGRVEMYKSNENMSHWNPLAVYAVHGPHGVQGIWCDPQLTKLIVATTTRLIVMSVTRKHSTAISLSKITELPYTNVHSAVLRDNDFYVVHGIGKLSHLAFSSGEDSSNISVIESHIALPIKATSIGTLNEGKALLVASSVDNTPSMKVTLNEDGSFASTEAEAIEAFRADLIYDSVGLAMYQRRFFDLAAPRGKEFMYLTSTLPPDTVFISKTQDERGSSLWIGCSLRGLLFCNRNTWWLADEEHRNRPPATDADTLNRSTTVALSGPRTTFVVGFSADDAESENKVLVLRRDIESEVETLPLMWKVRRFAN